MVVEYGGRAQICRASDRTNLDLADERTSLVCSIGKRVEQTRQMNTEWD
jgi:hypothetical protein